MYISIASSNFTNINSYISSAIVEIENLGLAKLLIQSSNFTTIRSQSEGQIINARETSENTTRALSSLEIIDCKMNDLIVDSTDQLTNQRGWAINVI